MNKDFNLIRVAVSISTRRLQHLDCSSFKLGILFRWELVDEIKQSLEDGVTVVIDRYAFSGVAFSAAKVGLNPSSSWECHDSFIKNCV